MAIKFQLPYEVSERVGVECSDLEFKAKQSFKDECDINKIMDKFVKTGLLDFVNDHEAHYADVSAIDFQTAMFQVAAVESMFADMPAQLRERFGHDAEQFLAFIQNPANKDEAVQLGLLRADTGAATGDQPVVAPVSAPTSDSASGASAGPAVASPA